LNRGHRPSSSLLPAEIQCRSWDQWERQSTHGLTTIQVTFLQRQGHDPRTQVNQVADRRLFWVPSVLPYNTTPSSMGRPGPGAEPVSQLAGHFAFAGGVARDRPLGFGWAAELGLNRPRRWPGTLEAELANGGQRHRNGLNSSLLTNVAAVFTRFKASAENSCRRARLACLVSVRSCS